MKPYIFKFSTLLLALAAIMACNDKPIDKPEEPETPVAPSDTVAFADPELKARILKSGADSNKDGYITFEEAKAVKELDLSKGDGNTKIRDISGLEHFTALETLDLSNNAISGNAVVGDEETGQYTVLELTSFLPSLVQFSLNNDEGIEWVDASDMTKLERLSISGTKTMFYLYVTGCPALKTVEASGNKALIVVSFADDPVLESLNLASCNLTSHSVPLFTNELGALKTLNISGHTATMSDGTPFFDVVDMKYFPALEELNVSNTLFATLDFSKNKALKTLDADRMSRLLSVDFRNETFAENSSFSFDECSKLNYVLVDNDAEKAYVKSVVAPNVKVIFDISELGGNQGAFNPQPATAVGNDDDQSPKSVGNMMWYPVHDLCGKTVDDMKTAEGEPNGALTSVIDGYTVYVYNVNDTEIKYRAYYTDADGTIQKIGSYSQPRNIFVVLKDNAWIVNPNFNPTFPAALTKEEDGDGYFRYSGAPYGASFSYLISFRAVLLDGQEYAEIIYTLK